MATYTIEQIFAAARAAGFTPEQAATWTAIALAESGGRTSALNDQGEHSMGLWQINVDPAVRPNVWGNLNDPTVNARAAYDISRRGTDMRPWTTTHDSNKGTSHDYRMYLDDVQAATGVAGDAGGVSGYHAPAPADAGDPPNQQVGPTGLVATTPPPDGGAQLDSDADGLTDAAERAAGSDPTLADTDADGLGDGYELGVSHTAVTAADIDADGLSDAAEAALGTSGYSIDTDNDGLSDLAESQYGTDPLVADAGDGVPIPTPGMRMASLGQPAAGPFQSGGASAAGAAPGGSGAGVAQVASPAQQPAVVPAAPATTVDTFVDVALAQAGDEYVFGATASLDDTDPDTFDCSELTRWAAHQAGVSIPDGAMYQYLSLKKGGNLVDVDEALHTKGALLFYFSTEPQPGGSRPSRAHVAISLGDGRTIEARGRAYGVGEFEAKNRFNYAGVVPGLNSTDLAPSAVPTGAEAPPPPGHLAATSAFAAYQIDAGRSPQDVVDTDADGLTDAFEALAGTDPTLADSDSDGLSDGYEALSSHTDPLSEDTDADGQSDAAEVAAGTDAGRIPGIAGVSGRGQFAENVRQPVVDSDSDGLSDRYELLLGLDPQAQDSDADGLSDALEVSLGTDPTRPDTDNDGLTDAFEQQLGYDPLTPGVGAGPGSGPGDSGLPDSGLPGSGLGDSGLGGSALGGSGLGGSGPDGSAGGGLAGDDAAQDDLPSGNL
ncbi:MAG: NlpC/P60 family protein [Actinomycetales bacterium]